VNYSTSGSIYGYFGFETWSVQFSAHNYSGTSDQVHDDTSSYHNNGNTNYARVYKDSFYGGQFSGPKAPGYGQNNMTDGWDNTLDSACFLSGSVCIGP
jgi:hypothetical protein